MIERGIVGEATMDPRESLGGIGGGVGRAISHIGTFISGARGATRLQRALTYITWAATLVALVGSVMSAFGICTGGCTDAEKYRIFGQHFATVGVPFFLTVLATSLTRNSSSWELRCPYDGLIFGAAGAEWFFISLQKYIIHHYCPVCLTIAGAVYVAVVVRLVELVVRKNEWKAASPQGIRWFVTSFIRGGVVFCALFVGLISALMGTNTPTIASAGTISQNIWLGDQNKDVEVLFVADWFCPYCKKAEPAIEKMLPTVERVARYTFIDDPIHEASYNFMPYNVSLLLNSKEKYLEGRKVLLAIAEKTKTPDDASVVAALAAKGIELKMADKAKLIRLANNEGGFLRANAVSLTPSIIVRNRRTGEHRLLAGADHVDQSLVLAAVNAVTH